MGCVWQDYDAKGIALHWIIFCLFCKTSGMVQLVEGYWGGRENYFCGRPGRDGELSPDLSRADI